MKRKGRLREGPQWSKHKGKREAEFTLLLLSPRQRKLLQGGSDSQNDSDLDLALAGHCSQVWLQPVLPRTLPFLSLPPSLP